MIDVSRNGVMLSRLEYELLPVADAANLAFGWEGKPGTEGYTTYSRCFHAMTVNTR